jgi:hypothetical protein
VRCRVHAFGLEDLPYRGSSDGDTLECQFAADTPVTQRRVLCCQAQDETADGRDSARTPRSSAHARAGVAVFHQVAMPPQYCVWADQQSESTQSRAGQRHEQRREKCLVFGSKSWSLVAGLSLQDGELVA